MHGFSLWQYDEIEEWENEVQVDHKPNVVLQQLITKQGSVEGYNLLKG